MSLSTRKQERIAKTHNDKFKPIGSHKILFCGNFININRINRIIIICFLSVNKQLFIRHLTYKTNSIIAIKLRLYCMNEVKLKEYKLLKKCRCALKI